MGSPMVFHTAPPQPASKARITWSPQLVGGPDASQKGFGHRMPAKFVERSAMVFTVRTSIFPTPLRGTREDNSESTTVFNRKSAIDNRQWPDPLTRPAPADKSAGCGPPSPPEGRGLGVQNCSPVNYPPRASRALFTVHRQLSTNHQPLPTSHEVVLPWRGRRACRRRRRPRLRARRLRSRRRQSSAGWWCGRWGGPPRPNHFSPQCPACFPAARSTVPARWRESPCRRRTHSANPARESPRNARSGRERPNASAGTARPRRALQTR